MPEIILIIWDYLWRGLLNLITIITIILVFCKLAFFVAGIMEKVNRIGLGKDCHLPEDIVDSDFHCGF